MKKSFNLADLKNDPSALSTILSSIKTAKPKAEKETPAAQPKKVKLKKSAKKKPRTDTSHIIVLDRSEEKEKKPKVEPQKEVKVRYDDDTQSRIGALDILITNIESYFNQQTPLYVAMQTLLSSAYRYTMNAAMRTLVAETRDLCKEALLNAEKKEKAVAFLRGKGSTNTVIRERTKRFSNLALNEKIAKNLEEVKALVETEKTKQSGSAYNTIHEEYDVDLSEYETKLDQIVMARADLMTTLAQPLDMRTVTTNKVEFKHVEGPIYYIKNALLVGFRPSALPKKIIEETLEIAIAQTFGVKGVPIVKQLRHRSSNRIWFFIPETSLVVKTVMFADRALNSEFDMFKSMTNDPSEDDIRFIFIRAGVDEFTINDVINRWKKSDSKRGRLTILHNAYVETKRRIKNARLRKQRESFREENAEILKEITTSQDRRQAISEIKEQHRHDFSVLASHTGREEHGLRIAQVDHLNAAFDQIESVAVRGNASSYERIKIREGVFKDKMKCRTIYRDYKAITTESKMLRQTIDTNNMILEINRKRAFHEISGNDDIENL